MTDPFAHRPPKSWLKITINTSEEQSDLIASFLTELTGLGVEQSIAQPGSVSTENVITGYLEKDANIEANREQIAGFIKNLPHPAPQIFYEDIIEEDWGENWKKHFKPNRVSNRITIKPTWEEYRATDDEVVIEIDPGLAFGTGLHASTRLALQLTEATFSESKVPLTVLDVGTGTGILGMAAALLGAHEVTAIDNDPDAVVCAVDNVRQNRLNKIVNVSGHDLPKVKGPYDLVIANITSDVLTYLAKDLTGLMAKSGKLILAGILAGSQAEGIHSTFTSLGLTQLQSPIEGEWQAFLFSA